jgi:hypothetical protein
MHRDKRQKERKQNDFHGSLKKKAVRSATTNHGWESKELVVREFGAPSFTHTSRTEPTRDVNDIRLFVVSLIVQYRACMMLSSPSGMMGVVVWLKSGGGEHFSTDTFYWGNGDATESWSRISLLQNGSSFTASCSVYSHTSTTSLWV